MDTFVIKYVGQEYFGHPIQVINDAGYELTINETGSIYSGTTLKWNTENQYADIAMPRYVANMIECFKHGKSKQPQYSPYQPSQHERYGKESKVRIPKYIIENITEEQVKLIQKVVGSVLCYAHIIYCTILEALSSIVRV